MHTTEYQAVKKTIGRPLCTDIERAPKYKNEKQVKNSGSVLPFEQKEEIRIYSMHTFLPKLLREK